MEERDVGKRYQRKKEEKLIAKEKRGREENNRKR